MKDREELLKILPAKAINPQDGSEGHLKLSGGGFSLPFEPGNGDMVQMALGNAKRLDNYSV